MKGPGGLVLLAFAIALMLVSPLGALADRSAPFLLGILRSDGLVMPFAAFDGKRWSSPWPAETRYLELPFALDGVPKRWWGKVGPQRQMTVWAGGTVRGQLTLERPAMMPVLCTPRLLLRSNYRTAEAPPPFEQPYPKDGLAIAGQPAAIDPIENIPRASEERPAAAVRLIEPAAAAENEAIGRFTDWKHPMSAIERRKVPVEVEALYRSPMDAKGWTAYYIEAVKRYPAQPDDAGCGLVTFVRGWLLLGPSARQRPFLVATVTYCDREGVTYMLPLGILHARSKIYWVYQVSGYQREWYVVAHPTPDVIEMPVEYLAGVCNR